MLLKDKKCLIFGVANNRSIAYGIASCFKEQGARLAFSYAGEAIHKRVEPISEELGGEFIFPCDVTSDEDIAAAAALVKEKWGSVDVLVHSVAFANREDLTKRFIETSRDGFATALNVSAYSLTALCHAFEPMLNPGASVGGMKAMMTTGFSSMDKLGKVLYQAAPLMMCGLSVGFAFKTGLFNIGASGQYTMGAFFALLCAIQFQMPWFVCLLAGAVGGAIWGIFPGLFKAYFNVNEVITAIMFNWIGMYLVNLLLANTPTMLASAWGASNSDRTAALSAANPGAILPKGPFAALFGNSSWINISIIITIVFAVLVWVVLQKTTFGYELKACGLSRDAAQYAGINSKRNIVLSMVISGALSGIGGGIYYLAGTGQYVLEKSILGMGFNGIPVALLASSNPIGTIFSALFISYIQVGGAAMQPAYSSETIDIVIAVIIYLAAFALLMRGVIAKAVSGRKEKGGAAK